MTTWIAAFVLALAAFGLMLLLKAPRRGWEAIGAALLLGMAGYAMQASPGLPGVPREAAEKASGDAAAAAVVAARQALSGRDTLPDDNWVVIADALARHGQYGEAAGVLLGAVEKRPGNAEAWLALANALTGHAEGTLTPAALYAYQHASLAAPDHPGPPFFLGAALANSGRLDEAREVWSRLLAASPADAPWREDLTRRLAALDAVIAARGANQ